MAFLFDDELFRLATPIEDQFGLPEKLQPSFRLALEGKGPFEAEALDTLLGRKPVPKSEVEEIQDYNQKLLKEAGALEVWELDPALEEELKLLHTYQAMVHEALNVYSLTGVPAPYLSPTWFLFREDQMDDIKEKAGESLDKPMFERLNISPVVVSEAGDIKKLFLARFEFPRYGAGLLYPEGNLSKSGKACLAWIDFLSGMHYGCCEMLMVVGEVSTRTEDFPAKQDDDYPVPPMPDELFDETYKDDKTLHTLNWLESDNCEGLADGISGEKEPENPHWWFRVNCVNTQKWPYPGEFLGLGNRIFPNLAWSVSPENPEFSPFLFSGMFMDTVFITSAHVLAVENTAGGYCKVKVKWREQEIWAYPTDFAQYEVDDRVTIVKSVTPLKTSELWKDTDLWRFDEEIWRVVPITYYGKGFGDFK